MDIAVDIDHTIYPYQLDTLLAEYNKPIQILSLDCFDTLLWRKTAAPADVFYTMQHLPSFQSINMSACIRARAETQARKIKRTQKGTNEITLHDIYLQAFPYLSTLQLNTLAQDELEAEIEACYALPATVKLIREARARGLAIIIVSDTYFNESQLRYLLEALLPADAMQAIDYIFCSCDHGKSKTEGIFETVLTTLNKPANTYLHIGDNYNADFQAPRLYQMQSLHLKQHHEVIQELLRMQTSVLCYMDSSIRHTRPLNQPFNGLLAITPLSLKQPEQLIGYASIGPILYAFAQFVHDEIQALKKLRKNPKILFLLRDAYLPALTYNLLFEEDLGACVPISRFAVIAASFRTPADVQRYLGDVLKSQRFPEICRQLLLPENIISPLLNTLNQAKNSTELFIEWINQETILSIVFENSKHYRERLKQHLINQVGLQENDTLVFVDLGYSGTAQTLLEPIFQEEMRIEILGRYLISLPVPGWEKSRKGLLDPSNYDERALFTLVNYIALLEQICTSNECSVIDYTPTGEPIYSDSTINQQQQHKLKLIQNESLRFAKDAKAFLKTLCLSPSKQLLQDIALGELSRLLFLPTQIEINYLQSFEFDVNLGTRDILKVFDHHKGLTGLRRRGLFYSFMEKSGKSMRMNYPAELRSAGIELSLAMLAQHRFGMELRINDISLRREKLNVIIIEGENKIHTEMHATYTHDGYFSLLIPIGTSNTKIGILFGQQYQFIQFESAEIIKLHAYLTETEAQYTQDIWSSLVFDQMTERSEKFFECLSSSGLALILINSTSHDADNLLLRVVFRPIISTKLELKR